MRKLRIAYLLEDCVEPWGGVMMVFREADALLESGHDVTIYSKTAAPTWHDPKCTFLEVPDFDRKWLTPHDIIVGTYFPTVPFALLSGCGHPVHYCQGYEGDSPQMAENLHFIESIYQLRGPTHFAISPFLGKRLNTRYGIDPIVVPYGIRDDLYRPSDAVRENGQTLRVALIGPWEISWKDIPTGVRAARMAREGGCDLELVRVSPTPLTDAEREEWGDMPVDWHEKLEQAQMPDVYRSCDLFLGTSSGGAEGFFMPAIEAMSCGIPVVLSDIDCFRDYNDPSDYATFVTPGDVRGFAEAIQQLLQSPEERTAWRAKSLETSKHHTFARHAAGMNDAFQALIPAGAALSEGGQPWDPHRDLPAGEFARTEMIYEMITQAGSPHLSSEQSIRLLETALDLDPLCAGAWNKLARIHCNIKSLQPAMHAVDKGLEVDPRNPTLWRLKGLIQLGQEHAHLGAESLALAIEYGHPGASIQLELTIAYLESSEFNKAEGPFRIAHETGYFDAHAQQLHEQIRDALLVDQAGGSA